MEENRSNQFAAEYNAAYPGAEENGNGPFAIIIYEEQTNITGDISETY
ncbi:MAG: hypothetical protein P8P83_03680 [Rickettsiaceae bacterium]|nr:hypothetical protein [Rickettsiaceae bacterium]